MLDTAITARVTAPAAAAQLAFAACVSAAATTPAGEPAVRFTPIEAADADAIFTTAYLEHRDAVLRWMTARTRDADLAEELVHEAYLRLLRTLRGGVVVENQRAWLFHAAGNLLVSHARHAKVADRHTPDDPGFETASAESVVLAQERLDHLERALVRLSPADREVLLATGLGEDGPSIALRAGISPVAFRARLCRARRRFRDQVASDAASCLAVA